MINLEMFGKIIQVQKKYADVAKWMGKTIYVFSESILCHFHHVPTKWEMLHNPVHCYTYLIWYRIWPIWYLRFRLQSGTHLKILTATLTRLHFAVHSGQLRNRLTGFALDVADFSSMDGIWYISTCWFRISSRIEIILNSWYRTKRLKMLFFGFCCIYCKLQMLQIYWHLHYLTPSTKIRDSNVTQMSHGPF